MVVPGDKLSLIRSDAPLILARSCCVVRRRASAWAFESFSRDLVVFLSGVLFEGRLTILLSTLICDFFLSNETASGPDLASFTLGGSADLALASSGLSTGCDGFV